MSDLMESILLFFIFMAMFMFTNYANYRVGLSVGIEEGVTKLIEKHNQCLNQKVLDKECKELFKKLKIKGE